MTTGAIIYAAIRCANKNLIVRSKKTRMEFPSFWFFVVPNYVAGGFGGGAATGGTGAGGGSGGGGAVGGIGSSFGCTGSMEGCVPITNTG